MRGTNNTIQVNESDKFLVSKLKSWIGKFYGHHYDLVSLHGLYVSQMVTNMFRLLLSQYRPFLIRDLSPCL